MGHVLSRMFERKGAQTLSWLPDFLMSAPAKSGVSVNYKTALEVTAVLACAQVRANGVAQVPWLLMKPGPGGKGSVEATSHELHELVTVQPNEWQSSFEFRETIEFHLSLCRNAYIWKNRVRGRIHELIILEPQRVAVTRRKDLSLIYEVTGEDGKVAILGQADVWHIRGASWNGWMGMEAIKLAREAIGLAIAVEGSHALMHANGVQPSGVYSVENTLPPDKYKLLQAWLKEQAATANRSNPLILDQGAKWIQTQMSGVDAQHLETRRYQVEEVCRAMGVMPIMIGVSDKVAAYASSEQMFLAHVVHCLHPEYSRIEGSAQVHLLTRADRREGLFTKFKDQALMRGDYKSRQEGLQIQRRNGVINADEWRALEDMNPRGDAGGAEYIVERNMGPNDGAQPAADPAPTT